MIPNGNICLKPSPPPSLAAIDAEFEKLQHETLALAAAWAGLNVRGLSLSDARIVIRNEVARLRAFAAARESGL